MIQLLDKFVGSNGTALADHTPNVGGPWTDIMGGLQIQSNKATGSDAAGFSTAPLRRRTAWARWRASRNGMDAGSVFSLSIDHDDSGNDYTYLKMYGDGSMKLESGNAGGEVLLLNRTAFLTSGYHDFGLRIGPSIVTAYVDGMLLFSIPRIFAPSLGLGICSLYITASAGTYPLVEDLLVTD